MRGMPEQTHTAACGPDPLALEAFDEREGYCRKLGHHVSFAYCRRRQPAARRGRQPSARRRRQPSARDALPCSRIADCWFERLPVEAYLKANYSPAELGSILAPAPPKLLSILEIVARVQAQAVPQAGPPRVTTPRAGVAASRPRPRGA